MDKVIDLMPIRWFGNRPAFEKSETKIITVGLNPSSYEFSEDGISNFNVELRFPKASNKENVDEAYNQYFHDCCNPYRTWFNNSFEKILQGMNASFYEKSEFQNRVLHTDLCSEWATNPTWSKLPKDIKRTLRQEGYITWKSLIEELQPDIMLISIAKWYRDTIPLEKISDWNIFKSFEKKNSKVAESETAAFKLNSGKIVNAYFSRAMNLPFMHFNAESKVEFGQSIYNEVKIEK